MHRYQVWEMTIADSLRSPRGFVSRNADRLKTTCGFFLSWSLLAPMFALPIVLRQPWVRLACVCLAFVFGGLMVSSWYQVHYAAPSAAIFVILYITCLAWCQRL